MKSTIILTIFFLLSMEANSQLTKGNWLLGGAASFSSLSRYSTAETQYKQTDIRISATIGYFMVDKIVAGLKPSFTYGGNTIGNSNTIFGIGPFARYYLLNSEKIFNLFTEAGYSYGSISRKGGKSTKSNTFSFSGGPVLYFNSSVGLEFTFGYSTTKVINFTGNNNEISFGIGFVYHLEKE